MTADKRRSSHRESPPDSRPAGAGRLLGLASLVVLGVLAVSLFLGSAFFEVTEVMVIGSTHLSRSDVVALCDIAPGTNILRVPTGAIRDRLQAEPRIETATVSRRFPDRILVEVVEREGVALLPCGEEYAELDSRGMAVELHRYIGALGLPVMTGLEVAEATPGEEVKADGLGAALCCASALGVRGRLAVGEIHVGPGEELTLYSRDGVPVRFGSATGLDSKVEAFLGVLPELEGGEFAVEYVDVRYPQYPVLGGAGDYSAEDEWHLYDPDGVILGGP